MLNRIKEFFVDRKAAPGGSDGHHTAKECHLAAAALLVHVASVDTDYTENERARLAGIAVESFGLSDDEAASLIEAAEGMAGDSVQIHGFTRAIKDGFDYEERVGLVEKLWEVVYSDHRMDEFEAQVMRRICGLIYVEDRDSGVARKRVLERLGREAP